MTARITTLAPTWRSQLLHWLPRIGIPCSVYATDDLGALQYREGVTADQPPHSWNWSPSWWDGNHLHLAPDPPFQALEWLYLAAHFGLAPEPRKHTVDFGLFGLPEEELGAVEEQARMMVIYWAACAGARGANLWRLAARWRMTRVAQEVDDTGVFNDCIYLHLQQTDALVKRCDRTLARWAIPPPPALWTEKFI